MGRHPQSRTSQSEVYGVFENVCPNLTSGRERIALTHLGGGIWTTGNMRCLLVHACPVALVLASQASFGAHLCCSFSLLLMLLPTCCSRVMYSAAE